MAVGEDERADGLLWVDVRRPAVIAGVEIADGGFYVGSHDEPSAVDPQLPVDLANPDWDALTVTGPDHYRFLTPAARAAYLVWLRTGRRFRGAPPIWARLYLNGLERRVLFDGDSDPLLQAEARALGDVYGNDPVVRGVATSLQGPPRGAPPPALTDDAAVPYSVPVEIGRRALASEPVDREWALRWAWFHPEIPRRDAAKRVPAEFAALWRFRFDERHPDGMIVAPRRRRLGLDYEPVNLTLPRPLELMVPDASDVLLTPGPERDLRELTEQVESELEAFARWATRHPDRTGSAAAAALLPAELLDGADAARAAEPFVTWAKESLATSAHVEIPGAEVVARWLLADGTTSFGQSDAVVLAQVLDRYDIGIEPDVRFGGAPVSDGVVTVLFGLHGSTIGTASPSYVAAAVATELCVAVATADGVVQDAETALLVEQINRVEGLSEPELARLEAHRLQVESRTVDLRDVAARIGALDVDRRQQLGDYLVDIALIDGVVSDGERRSVLAIFGLLGLDEDDADRRLGGRPDGTGETVATPATTDDAAEARPVPSATDLDRLRLERTQAANADVQALLGAIFADTDTDTEDEDDASVPPGSPGTEAEQPPGTGPESLVASLDGRHSALLVDLAAAGIWTRLELETAGVRYNLMPDGALEVVNEAAYDQCGDPVIETHDDGSVSVDTDVLEEMRS